MSITHSPVPVPILLALVALIAAPVAVVHASPPIQVWEPVIESPAPNSGAAMAIDAPHRIAYLFGGDRPGGGFVADVLSADLTQPSLTWQIASTSAGPSARAQAHAHFDVGSGRLLVLGGAASLLPEHDLWSWNPGTAAWTEIVTVDPGPDSITAAQPLAHDDRRDRLLYFDDTGVGVPTRVWALNLSGATPNWSLLTTNVAPVVAAGAVAAYDSLGDRVFLFGGNLRSLWSFDLGTGTWTQELDDTQCPFTETTAMTLAWDDVGNRLIAHRTLPSSTTVDHATVALGVPLAWSSASVPGGPNRGARPWTHDRVGRTILWDGRPGTVPVLFALSTVGPATWTSRTPPNRPMSSGLQGAADTAGRWWYMRDGLRFLRTSLETPGVFEDVTPAIPGPLWPNTASLEWDPAGGRLLLAMSRLVDETVLPGELWALVPGPSPQWVSVPTIGAPAGVGTAAAFDAARNWLYVTVATPQELWRVDLSVSPATWTHLGAMPFIATTIGIDPEGKRLLAGNGNQGGAVELAGTTPVFGPGLPNGAFTSAIAYDSRRDRLLVHNGAYQVSNTLVFQRIGTDALDGPSPPAFGRLDIPNDDETPATASLAVYDPVLDRMLLLNGFDYDRPSGVYPSFFPRLGMWSLQFDPAVPVRLELVDVMVEETGIHVRFNGNGALAGALRVEREQENLGDWQLLGTADESTPGVREYIDRTAVAGVRYRYRGRYRDEEGEQVTAPSASITRPLVESRLGLMPVAGTVSRSGRLDFEVVVPGGGAAVLELVDVRGRIVARAPVQGDTGAPAIVTLHAGATGLYFARLRQGDAAVTIRVVRL